jgi:hypothetical protein
MDLLDDLGPQLRALTSGQPAQPGDRVSGVTRRARRIRRTRTAVSVAAALAVLAPAGLLLSASQHHEATRFASSDLLSWPDRSDPAEARLSDAALDAYAADHPGADREVRWLARRALRLPDGGTAHIAVFIATEAGERSVVTMARRDDLASENPVPWGDVTSTPLAAGSAPDHIGLYLTHDQPDVGLNGFANTALLLADPRARAVAWHEQPLPAAPRGPQDATSGSATSRDGTFVLELGQLTGPVEATVSAGASGETYPLSLTDAPELIRPEIEEPFGWVGVGGGAFQSDPTQTGGWATPMYSVFDTSDTVLVSCYGGGTLPVQVTAGSRGEVLTSAQVVCDGNTHDIRHPRGVAPGTGASLVAHPTQLQAIAFVTGRTG